MGEARELAEAFYKAFADGDVETAMSYYTDDCISKTPAGALDKAGHEQMTRAFKGAFPDSRMEVERAVETGDEVFFAGRFAGTHTGDLPTPNGAIPASGRAIDVPFADYFRVAGGRIAAHEAYFDQLTMLGQIGALPG